MKKFLLLLILPFILASCRVQEKTDLSTLKLNESVESLINFDDEKTIGVETVEYPFSLLVELEKSKKYTFEGIDLSDQKIIFQINSEKLKTDSITRFGGGHIDLQHFKNQNELSKILKDYKADDKIYGVRVGIETKKLQIDVLKKLQSKYGEGTKNPNTDHGLYWNIKNENKYIFYAPDYGRLIILNNTNLSKTCYWDTFNGLIDFGGCNNETYTQELIKNATKPEDVKNKPKIKIDKNWNINGLVVGKTNEIDFVKSKTNISFERIQEINGGTGDITDIYYQNKYHDYYFYFSVNKTNPENKIGNIISGFSINNFKKVDITFENGLKVGMKFEDVVKLFGKNSIIDFEELKFSNYIEIKNAPYKVTLIFDDNMLFSGIYIK